MADKSLTKNVCSKVTPATFATRSVMEESEEPFEFKVPPTEPPV